MSLLRSPTIRWCASLAGMALASAPRVALACPVCFGALEGPVADGTNKAVLALLGVTLGVLASFGAFFVYLVRRARAMPIPAEFDTVRADGRLDEDDYMEGAA
jgi:hypothetical protein